MPRHDRLRRVESRDHRAARPPLADRARWAERLRTSVLAGSTALCVLAVLIPSEAAIVEGTFAPLAGGWCLLSLLWTTAAWLDPRPAVRWGWADAALAALVGWHSLTAVAAQGQVNGRQALNAAWLMIGYGLTVWLLRQSLRSLAHVRSLVAVMLWLATLVGAVGLFQYAYSLPALRRAYEANPQRVLAENGIAADDDSPQRELFENRVRSVEPLATFALTNSLAGFLAPWLIAALAIGLTIRGEPALRGWLFGLLLTGLALAACLVLTKSRTGLLAAGGGVVLVALYGRRGGRRFDGRIPAAGAVALTVIGLVATYFGGLDAKVLSEAPKSVLYRVEYWRATAALIAERPLQGCGPGNFQEAYTAFKLPEASETVADPHNFLLEMWATAGTPGLLLLLALFAAAAYELGWQSFPAPPSQHDDLDAGRLDAQRARRTIFGGALAGLILAAPLAILVGYPLEGVRLSLPGLPVAWALGFPLLAATYRVARPWIAQGPLTLPSVVIPLVVLLVNLLAAGALVFPGVMTTALVSLAAGLNLARRAATDPDVPATRLAWRFVPRDFSLTPTAAGVGVAAAAVLTLLCLRTEYQPVLGGQSGVAQALEAMQAGDPRAAEAAALRAARSDPWSPEPWRVLAELRFRQAIAVDQPAAWKAFEQAAERMLALNPRHHAAWFASGHWFFAAWRKTGRQDHWDEALAAYAQAQRRYPQRALYAAQLAWTYHVAGQEDAARRQAQRAAALDARMPHREQKLNRQAVTDPQVAATGIVWTRSETAEQTVERLRTTQAEDQP